MTGKCTPPRWALPWLSSSVVHDAFDPGADGLGSRAQRLGLRSYDGPRGEGGDDPERQIDQYYVEREHRARLIESEQTRAAYRQEEQKRRQHRRDEVQETEEVAPVPGGLDEETEWDAP